MKNLPTVFQRNTMWTAITAVSITVIGALAVGLIYLLMQVMGFLQPILVPFAVAAVLAYLLEPGVEWLERRKLAGSVPCCWSLPCLRSGLVAWAGGWW